MYFSQSITKVFFITNNIIMKIREKKCAGIAQWLARLSRKQKAASSNLASGNFFLSFKSREMINLFFNTLLSSLQLELVLFFLVDVCVSVSDVS
jgi:hypothetical protein